MYKLPRMFQDVVHADGKVFGCSDIGGERGTSNGSCLQLKPETIITIIL